MLRWYSQQIVCHLGFGGPGGGYGHWKRYGQWERYRAVEFAWVVFLLKRSPPLTAPYS